MNKCQNKAVSYFTWPNGQTGYICSEHKNKMLSVARMLGFYVDMRELSTLEDNVLCEQIVDKDNG